MSDEALKQFRTQIDRIDDELLRLFNQRATLAQQIGHAKQGGAVLRPEREAQVLQRMVDSNNGPLPAQSVTTLFTEVMSHCRALEEPLAVAYLGPTGSFSEAATYKRFGHGGRNVPCGTIDEVFRKVESGEARYGVVPVENSTEGAVGRTLDLLLQSTLKLCGEIPLQVHQCLMSTSPRNAIRRVYSHPQSLGQCQGWLNANLPNVERIAVASNSEAARMAGQEVGSAAIAGRQAAELFGLTLLDENIEDDPRNTTRFLVIGDQEVAPSGRDKTSLVLSAPNRPGAVHQLLTPLATHGVSMTKLESRPARSGLWEYVFFVDIDGHQQDAKVAAALAELRQVASFVKILGSYPVAV
ncbi:prephenate dehydratase [Ferriphaselus sp. R-1]|uniref:prephenate dehydratase n=1 Tax=Ferriphaselus sp. R-1 TaxID=1485544 RepID=UPI00054FF7A1|nr:prephenate dehydratase [Ferriphaselus sp. R-1]